MSMSKATGIRGTSLLSGLPPIPEPHYFEDFIGKQFLAQVFTADSTIADTTVANDVAQRLHVLGLVHGSTGAGSASIPTTYPWGLLQLGTTTTTTVTSAVCTSSPVVGFSSGVTPGDENPIAFYARLRLNGTTAITHGSGIFGLFSDDSTIPTLTGDLLALGTTSAGSLTNGFGFKYDLTTTAINAISRKDTAANEFTETILSTGKTMSNYADTAARTQFITFGAEFDGKSSILFSINGEHVGSIRTNLPEQGATPAAPLWPVFMAKTTGVVEACNMHIDWIYAAQNRRPLTFS